MQERLTTQIAEELERILNPLGVAVIIEATHLCMMMRGVEKQNSYTITSAMLGRSAMIRRRARSSWLCSADWERPPAAAKPKSGIPN